MRKWSVFIICFIFMVGLFGCGESEVTVEEISAEEQLCEEEQELNDNENTFEQEQLEVNEQEIVNSEINSTEEQSENASKETEEELFLAELEGIEGDFVDENDREIPDDAYNVERMFGTHKFLLFEDSDSFLEAFGFEDAEPFYEFYADGKLELTLYYDEKTQLGCSDYGSNWGFCFLGLEEKEWSGYLWGDYMEPVVVYSGLRPEDYMGDYSYDEIKEYNDAGQLIEYRVTNIADLTAEYTNIENLKDGTVLWNDALVVSYSYNDDGTLAYRKYNHNLYLFGSNTGTLETWFDEKGRPIYEQAYITHGTLNWFYIYEDEDEIPEYILYVDNNGGQAEFTMYR